MCDDCFKTEIKSFPDETSWTAFDRELTQKLGQGKMKLTKFIPDGQRGKDDGQYIYACLTCGDKWKLREPDQVGSGYFLQLSRLEKVTTSLTIGQKIALRFLGLIIIRLIYGLLTN